MVQRRLWTVWPAHNRFCCDGACIMGPAADACPLWTGWLSLIATGAVFGGTTAVYLWENVHVAWPIVGIILWVADFYFYARACFSDPGILPRGYIVRLLTSAGGQQRRTLALAAEKRTGDIYQNSAAGSRQVANIEAKQCSTCDIERPPLSSHCAQCDNCVEIWDHHCNWIGNCVGQRNHRMFVSFVTCTTIFCVYLIVAAVVHLVHRGGIGGNVQDIGSLILIISMALTACFMINMSSYHLGLVAQGHTLKMHHSAGDNQNGSCTSNGCSNLWTFFCCYSSRTSQIDFREYVDT